MVRKDTFFQFVQPAYLYGAAIAFAILTVLIVILIYIQLYRKRRQFNVVSRIEQKITMWISETITADTDDFVPTPELSAYLRTEKNREFLIDNLIKVRKNLTGAAATKIVALYVELGLKKDSMKRFNSVIWHHKAKGIYELYMMDQEQELPDIYTFTNSSNEYVRMEAQVAIVGFWGFEGLTFLNTLSYPLHEWQQIKLLEQLSTLDVATMEQLPQWLRSGNEYVVHFALKLAEIYQQMDVHDIVKDCLDSGNEQLRHQAIKTLGKIANETTAAILVQHYSGESSLNKKEILKQLSITGEEEHIPFLESLFTDHDDLIRLEALSAIARISGTVTVLDKYTGALLPDSIINQVKYQFGK